MAEVKATKASSISSCGDHCGDHFDDYRKKQKAQSEAWRLLGERLELLTRGDGNVVTLKRRRKAA